MSKPAHRIQDGTLKAVIWRNTSTEGKTYYTVNLQRSYRNGDDTWRETDSLNVDDLLAAAELLREAYRWIRMQKQADRDGLRQADGVTAK